MIFNNQIMPIWIKVLWLLGGFLLFSIDSLFPIFFNKLFQIFIFYFLLTFVIDFIFSIQLNYKHLPKCRIFYGFLIARLLKLLEQPKIKYVFFIIFRFIIKFTYLFLVSYGAGIPSKTFSFPNAAAPLGVLWGNIPLTVLQKIFDGDL